MLIKENEECSGRGEHCAKMNCGSDVFDQAEVQCHVLSEAHQRERRGGGVSEKVAMHSCCKCAHVR